ncbi:TrmB family transcriptional regulator [Halopenitus persicus]|uniref:Sugar-specific transcriptional regulator TrmB n=1 Tax=Halopenitus persicus TaxID=1048396 RepID=A0A1H3KV48_9EURY|nr:helix-turn-helix domain-containing protein [Halopenitus persicus]QHS18004.1 TrmB family transcriptional regulator [haloarchaeon 3A1-DGR]SDY55896.1 Sugar-specific transcriptional regulator TrmB [Halopenitus persicus]
MASLRDLGLSEYEARAYRALLGTGPTTAKELSRTSDVPMGRIYDVLNGLEDHDLIRSRTENRPKKYVAVDPDAALDRLLATKRREFDERMAQYESVVDTLSAELEAEDGVEDRFWTAAVGTEETIDLLLQRIAAATDRIVIVADTPAAGLDLGAVGERVMDAIVEALGRGVETRVLLSPEIVDRLPGRVRRRYADRLADREAFTARTVEGIEGAFNLFDGVEVCLEVPNPLAAAEPFAMIDLTDPEFAADVRERFEPRWAEATPLELSA